MQLDSKIYPAESLAADRRQSSEDRRAGDCGPSRVEEARVREAGLDETLAATFPASDPPSSIPNPLSTTPRATQSLVARPASPSGDRIRIQRCDVDPLTVPKPMSATSKAHRSVSEIGTRDRKPRC